MYDGGNEDAPPDMASNNASVSALGQMELQSQIEAGIGEEEEEGLENFDEYS